MEKMNNKKFNSLSEKEMVLITGGRLGWNVVGEEGGVVDGRYQSVVHWECRVLGIVVSRDTTTDNSFA